MALPSTYATGTITVAANGTVVTGAGTNWIAGGIRAGDVLEVRGLSVSIDGVTSATALTLKKPWPGPAHSSASYEIRYTPDATRVLAASRAALETFEGLSGELINAPTTSPSDLTELLLSTKAISLGTQIVTRAEGYGYEVVASGGDLLTAGGVHLRRVVRPDDHYDLRGQTYMPAITRTLVDAGLGKYCHVPAIAIRPDGHILGAYLRNETSPHESEDYQRIVMVRSNDKGATWTPAVEELNEAATCHNPLTLAARPLQSEIFVAYDHQTDQEIAVWSTRGIEYASGFISFRPASPGAKWTNYRVLATSNGGVELSSTSLTGVAPAGLSQRRTVDGVPQDIFFFKPVFDHTGRKLVIPMLLGKVVAGGTNQVAFLIRENGAWRVTAHIPTGEADIESAWEPTTWQADDGTWYCQVRNNKGAAGVNDNHLIASSPDLESWTPWAYRDTEMHVNRIINAKASDRLWLGVGTTHPGNRHALSLLMSVDGHQWSPGLTISDEDGLTHWAQYSDIAFHADEAYILYSTSEPMGVNSPIRFARVPLPTGVPISGNDANFYVLDTGMKPYQRGGWALVIPPRMRGAVAGCGRPHVINLRCRVTAVPGPVPYVLAAVGNARWGYLTVEYRQGASGTELFAGGIKIGDVGSPTSWTDFQIAVDPLSGIASAFGQARAIGRFATAYLGDVSPGGTDQAGSIEYDGARCRLAVYPAGLPRLLRPEFPPLVGSSVLAQGDNGDANLITDAGPGGKAHVRYRAGGTTRAATFYDDTAKQLREEVGGGTVRRVSATEQEMVFPVKMFSPLRAPASTLTLTNGAITVSRMAHAVTQGDLHTITGGADGDLLILGAGNSGQPVTIKHGVGNVFCGGSDKVLSSIQHRIMLHRAGTAWHMISANLA